MTYIAKKLLTMNMQSQMCNPEYAIPSEWQIVVDIFVNLERIAAGTL